VNQPKRLLAYLLAPIATLLCFFAIGTIESVYWMMAGIPKFNNPSTAAIVMAVLVIGVPFLYIVSAVVGVLVVWWLEKRNKVSLRHFALAGLLCGLVLAGGFSFLLRSSKYYDHLETFALNLLFVAVPVTFGFVSCWYVGYRTQNEKA